MVFKIWPFVNNLGLYETYLGLYETSPGGVFVVRLIFDSNLKIGFFLG